MVGATFVPKVLSKPKSILKSIYRIVRLAWEEDKVLLIAYFSTSVLGALLLYVVFFAYKLMIDQVAASLDGGLQINIILIIGTYLFFEYLSRFVNYTFNNYYFDYVIRAKFQNALTRKFMRKLANLDFAHIENGSVRNLIAKVESTYNFRLPEILTKINAIIFNGAALSFSLFVALQFNLLYFLVLGMVSLPIYYLRAKYGNVAWSSYTTNAPKTNYLWYLRYMFTNFETLSEMKIYGLKDHFLNQTEKLQKEILEDYQRPIMLYSILSTVSFILIPVAIYFSVSHFISNMGVFNYSIGDFTFFLNSLFTFSGQISSILVNVGSIYENNLFVNDFFELMNIKPAVKVKDPIFTFSAIAPRTIEFKKVSFAYSNSTNLSLNKVSFKVERGKNLALVGQNGAGKSTIIKLLFRFYDPQEGVITVDNVDLRRIPIEHWYAHLGVLFQDYARYFLSLKENIEFGRLDQLNSEKILESLAKAEGDELIKKLPLGLDQKLGRWFEGGVELSGGQWQKVAIARAIYRSAPILILDEPTSAIDADAEAEIFDNLHQLYEKQNLIFISHRFSTVRHADQIVVMESGQVAEQGTHDELIRKNKLYADLFKLQKKGYI